MTPEEGYREAERRIVKAHKLRSQELELDLSELQLTKSPPQIAQLSNLQYLYLYRNQIVEIPCVIAQLPNLQYLDLSNNQIVEIPDAITQLSNLQYLYLSNNQIVEIPDAITQLSNLRELKLNKNPLNPALAAVYQQGLPELKNYLRERAKSQITLNEGKLILVGEGEVGKSCLLGALRGDEWIEGRPTTHGIEIKPCQLEHNATQITLNAWDFGGQPVYRPTHQLW